MLTAMYPTTAVCSVPAIDTAFLSIGGPGLGGPTETSQTIAAQGSRRSPVGASRANATARSIVWGTTRASRAESEVRVYGRAPGGRCDRPLGAENVRPYFCSDFTT